MTLFLRLILCLFALALLPGAPVHARMAMAAASAHDVSVPLPAGNAMSTCHEVPPAALAGVHHADAEDAGAAASHADCCGKLTEAGDCAGACPCPSTAPALPPPPLHAAFVLQARHGNAPVPAGRAGPTHAPPKRPPIG